MYPYRRFAVALADADARLGAGVVRYSFAVGLSHSFQPAGFDRRTENLWASEHGPLPRHATLTIAPLPALAHASQDEYLATLRTAVVARETDLARERQRAGRSVLGRRQVLRQSAFGSPGSSEPRRQPSPRVAGGNKWARIEALARLRSFLAGYREAWLQWRAGASGVVL